MRDEACRTSRCGRFHPKGLHCGLELRRIERLCRWGRKAELLFQNEKLDDAEAALQKALDLNPNYPYGLYLRGQFRLREGEVPGALILLRKAADLYDAGARDILGHLYMVIFDCEMKLNHPVAARAAAELSLRADASNAELVKGIDTVFGPNNPNLPAAAKEKHAYRALPATAPAAKTISASTGVSGGM